MKTLLQDLRFAGRLLYRSPGFSLLVVLTLALGIGANLAIFSVVDAVVLAPLPYRQPDRLVTIWEMNTAEGLDHERLSPVNFLDYRQLEGTFEDAAAWWNPEVNLTDDTGDPIRVTTIETSSNLFSVLGVQPRLGPGFEPVTTLHEEGLAVVISDRLWKQRYGGDPQVVGKTLRLNGDLYTGRIPRGERLTPPVKCLAPRGRRLIPWNRCLAPWGRRLRSSRRRRLGDPTFSVSATGHLHRSGHLRIIMSQSRLSWTVSRDLAPAGRPALRGGRSRGSSLT